jgi:hypothetical protein
MIKVAVITRISIIPIHRGREVLNAISGRFLSKAVLLLFTTNKQRNKRRKFSAENKNRYRWIVKGEESAPRSKELRLIITIKQRNPTHNPQTGFLPFIRQGPQMNTGIKI